ncbi:MAG: CRISPR-associated endonuclease Cas2 [Thiolinea sp.]
MSAGNRLLYLACYDVADERRLKVALQVVRRFATGGQKSVHEVWLSAAEKGDLLLDMGQLLEPGEDSFLLIRLDPRQKVHTLGTGVPPGNPDWFYLG